MDYAKYYLQLGLLDELCDKLDESGIEGNVIKRDSYGRPYVNIWPGSYEDHDLRKSEMFTVIVSDDGCYEIKPSNKYAVYYVYFNNKYGSVAKEIQDDTHIITGVAGVTSSGGYKFLMPKHVINFVKEVVRRTDEMKREPIMMKWEVRTPATPLEIRAYAEADVLATAALYEYRNHNIVDVIFNDPATIIIWADGSKTVVKAENEPFDPEKGLAMAISKKVLGNKHDYYEVFKKYVGRYEKKQKRGKK